MGRLFWKIFLWFWGALLLLNLAVGFGVKLYFDQVRQQDEQRLAARMEAAARYLERGDPAGARAFLRPAQPGAEPPIFAVGEDGRDLRGHPLPPRLRHALTHAGERRALHRRTVHLPDGRRVELVAWMRPTWMKGKTRAPLWLGLAITVLVSTGVCYGLARYLAKPLQELSRATRRLASGALEVRVGPLRRRDEIADLARDFDHMADRLGRLLAAQRQLLRDISHELRSPLARLQVALALAERHCPAAEADFARIRKDLDRLDALIGELLTLARMDTVTYPRERLELDELLAEIVEASSLEAEQRGCRILLDAPPLCLEGSPELLRRAVENVLRNAVRHTAPGSAVEVRARREGEEVVIAVDDCGPGLAAADRERIFEPFVRLDPARGHRDGGHGLGLAIARKAAELHGGTIAALPAPGGGLRVEIRLPAT
ncbi:MAG: two-component sensor histidine kinase [Porticoccaceae bacterium]|nr:MAG: two-component sensor histidine kinase [Porticoccaceae bacterium]